MVRKLFVSACMAAAMFAGSVQADVTLNGAGATFPKPMYDKFVQAYTASHPDVKINYSSVGSGAGIKQISEQTVDFGGTDAPMTDKQLAAAKGGALYHIPTVLGAVVPIYNLPGVDKPVNFSGPVIADIFLGKITSWDDARIVALNEGVKLPAKAISVVHRSDGSGTTAIFADYLSKVSPEWAAGPGRGTAIKWIDNSLGGKGNEQVAAIVQKTEGAIGYVELIFAANNKIAFGNVQNAAGKFVTANLEAVSASAAGLKEIPADLRMSITNADGEASYPISGLTWILVYENQKDAAKGQALVNFLWWATHGGQSLAGEMHYAPLPKALLPTIEAKLTSIKADGKVIEPQK